MATLRKASLALQPRVSTKTTVEATTEVTIAPTIKTKLLKALHTYAQAAEDARAAKATKEVATAVVRKIREATGSSSIEIDGFKMTDTGGDQFDRDATYKKLMSRFDLSIEDIKACEIYKPKKRFEKITCPGQSDND